MSRTSSPISVCATTRRRRCADIPIVRNRRSEEEWSRSGNVVDNRPSKTVAASRKSTRCVVRFAAASSAFHVNVTPSVYTSSAAETPENGLLSSHGVTRATGQDSQGVLWSNSPSARTTTACTSLIANRLLIILTSSSSPPSAVGAIRLSAVCRPLRRAPSLWHTAERVVPLAATGYRLRLEPFATRRSEFQAPAAHQPRSTHGAIAS